ncbi:MAG: heme o synthase [Methyloligellaceae bacterium]
MTDTGLNINDHTISNRLGGDVSDYFALLKPRVMSLVIFTGLVGMVVAPGEIHPFMAFIALLCIAVGAGASGALNMWYDADIDAKMQRTVARPIPRGAVTPDEALALGSILSAGSVLMLGLLVNWVAGALLALTIGFYIFVYTMWLKRRTSQNIVIGGAAGAFPPMIGWAAVTGDVSVDGIILFAIIFMWTPAHFWALALYRSRDYERVGVPMLPVVAGSKETRKQILIYSALLVVTSLLPVVTGLGGLVYLVTSIVLSAVFMLLAAQLFVAVGESHITRIAKRLFAFSILYLFLHFAVLLIESGLGLKFLIWNMV